jgi:hypothetical protein
VDRRGVRTSASAVWTGWFYAIELKTHFRILRFEIIVFLYYFLLDQKVAKWVIVIFSSHLLEFHPSVKKQTIVFPNPLMMLQYDRETGYLESKIDHARFSLFGFQWMDIDYCAYPNPISIVG